MNISKVISSLKLGLGLYGITLPFKDETTTFIACGPAIKQGVVVERRSMVDEAPTMAKMLGFEMPDIDGVTIEEILK